ncbi:MAG TPA: twin-arginine translocase subunit TatC [candidate division Zixibacteria bacterium]|nr:twin-arginine translocase subunit TatC [candidate division Zixibacteria bacterium]HBZ00930.1 twin-arginine translocase subunit TatC [candidate division Zixibacteria bacterium]
MNENKAPDMPILEHLEELRWRIIKIMIALCVTSIACYFFTDTFFRWIRWPLDMATPPGQVINLNYLRIGESFSVRIRLAILAGVFISIPITLFQIWRFVAPGLYKHERRSILPLVFWSSLLFLVGSAMCFFWVMPITIKFLLALAPENVVPMLTINEYINFVMWTTVSFGLVFQLPLVALFLGKLGLINWRMMARGRRYAIVGIAFVAAVVTPSTDALSMILLALPLYLLYEVSIWLLRFRVNKTAIPEAKP